MPVKSPTLWISRIITVLFAALAAASASYWVLKWPASAGTPSLAQLEHTLRPIDVAKVSQLLGATTVADSAGTATQNVNLQSQYKLWGVIAQGPQSGSALIATEGEAAKPYRLGDRVGDSLVLRSVSARSVTLSPQLQESATVTLDLPLLPGTRNTP